MSPVGFHGVCYRGVYSIYRKDPDKYGGGVAMFISEKMKFFKREDLETDFESLTVELDIQYVKPILITTIYRPLNSLVDLFDKADDLLRKIEFENRESVIVGDMYCNLLKEENHTKHIRNLVVLYIWLYCSVGETSHQNNHRK